MVETDWPQITDDNVIRPIRFCMTNN